MAASVLAVRKRRRRGRAAALAVGNLSQQRERKDYQVNQKIMQTSKIAMHKLESWKTLQQGLGGQRLFR